MLESLILLKVNFQLAYDTLCKYDIDYYVWPKIADVVDYANDVDRFDRLYYFISLNEVLLGAHTNRPFNHITYGEKVATFLYTSSDP